MDRKNIATLLTAALKRKQMTRPQYTQAALARDLGVTPTFVNNILRGKKTPPRERIADLAYFLELDIHERKSLSHAILSSSESSEVMQQLLKTMDIQVLASRHTLAIENQSFLSKWWTIAILEGLSLEAPLNSADALCVRLGISETQYDESIKLLARLGLIENTDGGWLKKDSHVYVASGRSKDEVRNFHAQMIGKALDELQKKRAVDFERRLVTGFTFALDPQHLESLKSLIMTFLNDLSTRASQGECTEVYQCNLQLVPLTLK